MSGNHYYKAQVWAEMRKSVCYTVDLLINDKAIVEESQCECGAGQGPNAQCKHIGAVLFALHMFPTHKAEFISEVTCTQKLQSFHQAKKHRGSPKKAGRLIPGQEHSFTFDPRPVEHRKSVNYKDHFRNTVTSYTGPESNMPVLHLYKPANPYAFANDHDYDDSNVNYFLKAALLSSISETEIKEIELHTREQASSSNWLLYRQCRLTASHFGDICKLTDRRDLTKFCENIINPRPFSSRATRHGQQYEIVAKQAYEQMLGEPVEKCGFVHLPTTTFLGRRLME